MTPLLYPPVPSAGEIATGALGAVRCLRVRRSTAPRRRSLHGHGRRPLRHERQPLVFPLGPLGFDFAQRRQTLRPPSSRDPQ
jgi:hypothetical protein